MQRHLEQLGRREQQGRSTRGAARGFSLVELLIVVAVILIIAAIAIPNFIRSRMRANEAAAVSNLRNITTAEVVYSTTYGIGYSTDLVKLAGNGTVVDSDNAGLIDDVLGAGLKSGYTFTYSVVATDGAGRPVAYTVNADPIIFGRSGERYFFTDQSAIIRHSLTGPATASDPAID